MGSEMCIRDSPVTELESVATGFVYDQQQVPAERYLTDDEHAVERRYPHNILVVLTATGSTYGYPDNQKAPGLS